MSRCRDCSRPASPMDRSCPHCGILNPVGTWVVIPEGSHLPRRAPVFRPTPPARPSVAPPPAHGVAGAVARLLPFLPASGKAPRQRAEGTRPLAHLVRGGRGA